MSKIELAQVSSANVRPKTKCPAECPLCHAIVEKKALVKNLNFMGSMVCAHCKTRKPSDNDTDGNPKQWRGTDRYGRKILKWT